MEPNRADIEALAGSARWIERLARSLVADPHAPRIWRRTRGWRR